jgi:IS5 family transposase
MLKAMQQVNLGLNLTTKRTRKREFLDEMERVVPWAALVALITPFAPEGKSSSPPFAVQTMLCRRCWAFTSCSSGSR